MLNTRSNSGLFHYDTNTGGIKSKMFDEFEENSSIAEKVKNKNDLTLYMLANTISPRGTMGGNTKILIEFARRWAASGLPITIFTYEEGLKTCQDYKLNGVNYVVIPSSKFKKFGFGILSAVQIINTCIRLLKIKGDIVIYSASSWSPDVIPAILMKKKNPSSKWIASCFLRGPSPFKGFDLAYEKKRRLLPNIRLLASSLMDFTSNVFIVRYADAIFVTNDLDKKFYIDKGVSPLKLRAIYGGVELAEIEKIPEQQMKYDGCFVGRIHPQKGVIYLINIWGKVCEEKRDAKLALIGNGPKWYENKVKDEISKRHLEKNIDLFGFVDGTRKYKILKSSKVFLHTSVYDNCGMTAAEGMTCGLPAVRFDIPELKVAYPRGMLVAPLKDCETFAKCVLTLLTESDLYNKVRQDALGASKNWDWDKRAQEALNWLKMTLSGQVTNGESA